MKAATTIKQDIPLPRWEEVSINHLITQTYGRLKMKETNDFAPTADVGGHMRKDRATLARLIGNKAAVFVAPSRTSPQRDGITKTKSNKENGEADSRKVEAKELIQINLKTKDYELRRHY
jgi:hypothetical protein